MKKSNQKKSYQIEMKKSYQIKKNQKVRSG